MMKKIFLTIILILFPALCFAGVGLYGNPVPLIINKDRNSPVLLKLYDIDNTVYTPAEMAAITKVEIKYIPASGEDSESIDSATCAACFDWSTFAEYGELWIDLGSVAFTPGRDREVEVIVYTAAETAGRVVGRLDMKVDDSAVRDAAMIDPLTTAIALNDLSDVDATGGSTGDVVTQQADGTFALQSVGAASVTNSAVEEAITAGAAVTEPTDGGFIPVIISETLGKITWANLVTALGLGEMAEVDDAPSDGTGYVRKDGAWAEESGGGGTGDGDVTGPDGATAGNIPVLDVTGKILSDSGKAPSDFLESETDPGVTTHESAYNHELIATAVQTESDPDFAAWLSSFDPFETSDETDPVYSAWLIATPPLYPGGWYDALQGSVNISGFNNDAGYLTAEVDGSTTNEIQTIDVSQLSGTTLQLSLSDDGEATKEIDLSSLQDGTGTDDQTAAEVSYANTTSGLSATDAQAAIDEVEGRVDINDAKVSNVPTALEIGTRTATTMGITSDGGADDVTLPEADTDNAGLLGADKWDEIVANTAKVTFPGWANFTLTSQAIGDIFYADSTTTITRLADVAAGQPLLSGGVTTAPAYAGYTFSGTTAQTYTFPSTSATLAKLSGNTFTGTHDFGGADDLKVPNGANPTVDTAGQVAVDSSAAPGSGIRFYGDDAYTLAGTYSKSFVILNPVATDDYPIWCAPYAITIKHVRVQCLGGTNIVGQLTECDGEGINCVMVDDSDITATANNSIDDDGTLSNPSIDAGDYVGWKTESISGTPTSVTVTFDYIINQVN